MKVLFHIHCLISFNGDSNSELASSLIVIAVDGGNDGSSIVASGTIVTDLPLVLMSPLFHQANPPALLSTVQYVNLFYEKRLKGEDQYWWTQFCAAIEFIKTMDYHL